MESSSRSHCFSYLQLSVTSLFSLLVQITQFQSSLKSTASFVILLEILIFVARNSSRRACQENFISV